MMLIIFLATLGVLTIIGTGIALYINRDMFFHKEKKHFV